MLNLLIQQTKIQFGNKHSLLEDWDDFETCTATVKTLCSIFPYIAKSFEK